MKRAFVTSLFQILKENARFLQVVLGPRQVGKATGILQLREEFGASTFRYESADSVFTSQASWLQTIWSESRLEFQKYGKFVLAIDEIQSIAGWSSLVKVLWDEDKAANKNFHVILLGSSSLDLHSGLSESLTGRFELTRVTHWDFFESKRLKADLSLDEYLKYGGYPELLFFTDEQRRRTYLANSILETVIMKDILQNVTVKKPALFKQTLEICCMHAAEILSLNKILGQLQEGGNVDLVKYYLGLYEKAFLLTTLEKFSTNKINKKTSSPKLIPMAPAFLSYFADFDRGRAFELAVGIFLVNKYSEVYYWREKNHEVDYILKLGSNIIAIEVKSGKKKKTNGLERFIEQFNAKGLIVTPQNFDKIEQLIDAL